MTPVPPSPSPARPSRNRIPRAVRAGRILGIVLGIVLYNVGLMIYGIISGRGVLDYVVLDISSVINAVIIGIVFWTVSRSMRKLSVVLIRRASDRGALPAGSGLMAGAAWRVMRAAARLMPRAAGSRWLAEAASFLSEAPPAQRRRALRSYLTAAPKTILVSWASHLARRTRAR